MPRRHRDSFRAVRRWTRIAGDVLGEQRPDRGEAGLDAAFSHGEPSWAGCRVMPIARQALRTPRTCRPSHGRRRWSPGRSPAGPPHRPAAGRCPSASGAAAPTGTCAAHPPSRAASAPRHRAGQQQRRVRGLGRCPQHHGRDGPGRDVDDPGQLGPVGHAVVQDHPHVQRVESICVHSPGLAAVTVPNGPAGVFACDRRVRADPKVCFPEAACAASR